jgi:D-sedoheptulose 7-phosphate isomerase
VMGSMRDRSWGRIVNLASNSLGLAVPNMVPYMAPKGGVVGFTRALATDLAPFGITVNAVCPTASATPGGQSFIGDEVLGMVAGMQAIERVGTATDIVGTICFLSSDDSAFLTGQTIVADGGLMSAAADVRSAPTCPAALLPRLYGQLQVGGVFAAGVDDVLPAVGRGVPASSLTRAAPNAPSYRGPCCGNRRNDAGPSDLRRHVIGRTLATPPTTEVLMVRPKSAGDLRPAAELFARRTPPGRALAQDAGRVAAACHAMAMRLHRGGKVLVFGMGAAATDAQHIAVEFVHPVIVGKRALPAMSLTNDVATVTGLAAERGEGEVFAHQIRYVARPDDIALGVSDDDRSTAVLRGLEEAAARGLLTVALVGGADALDGPIATSPAVDHVVPARSDDPRIVKELQVTTYHVLWELVHVFFEQPGVLGPAVVR